MEPAFLYKPVVFRVHANLQQGELPILLSDLYTAGQ